MCTPDLTKSVSRWQIGLVHAGCLTTFVVSVGLLMYLQASTTTQKVTSEAREKLPEAARFSKQAVSALPPITLTAALSPRL
jgi:hypothetical protein